IGQLKDLFGLQIAKLPADLWDAVPALWVARHSASLAALAVGVVSIIAIGLIKRRTGTIVVLALASAAVALLALPVDTIHSRFGAMPNGFAYPSLPHVSLAR